MSQRAYLLEIHLTVLIMNASGSKVGPSVSGMVSSKCEGFERDTNYDSKVSKPAPVETPETAS